MARILSISRTAASGIDGFILELSSKETNYADAWQTTDETASWRSSKLRLSRPRDWLDPTSRRVPMLTLLRWQGRLCSVRGPMHSDRHGLRRRHPRPQLLVLRLGSPTREAIAQLRLVPVLSVLRRQGGLPRLRRTLHGNRPSVRRRRRQLHALLKAFRRGERRPVLVPHASAPPHGARCCRPTAGRPRACPAHVDRDPGPGVGFRRRPRSGRNPAPRWVIGCA